MDHITSLKGQNHELKAREEESYQQVKQSVQLVEQAQYEETQVFLPTYYLPLNIVQFKKQSLQ